jgi:hypothetical protein
MKELIKLFRAVEIKSHRKKKPSISILRKTLKYGFTFSPEVFYHYSDKELENLFVIITSHIGLTPEQLNNSFHKSWKKIKEADIAQLFLEQILHYITTYGFESLGIYDEDSVYIPKEKLEIPEVKIDDIKIIVIKGYTKEEIKEKVLELLRSGVALHEDTIKDIVEVSKQVNINQENISDIKNKEVKVALCDHLNLLPEEPVEFLRYVLFKTTGKTLLIKDSVTITEIKSLIDDNTTASMFRNYQTYYGLEKLSEIFYRFKPIFLAFKTQRSMKSIINKLRKLAIKNHKPMSSDYLNEITALIKRNVSINKSSLEKALSKVNSFRKIRLAYALKYRTRSINSIMYKIRNGKAFSTDFFFANKKEAAKVFNIVVDSLVEDIKRNVKDKKIFIPPYIKYALPATEKQFTGNFPSGTCITIPNDMIVGINWFDVERRIDLDLSLINLDIGKIGWDSSYRTSDKAILFSGDMTSASGKNGATELFYVKRQVKQELLMLVNYYNFRDSIEVPFSIIVAKEQTINFGKNYMVNPNNIMCIAKTKIKEKQKILGLLISTTKGSRFYFCETAIGRSITSSNNDYVENSRKYMSSFYQNMIDLNYLLSKAGAEIVESNEKCDIDLSPENLEKDTIIKLLI